MKILHILPHPFYQERGTPIDDLLVIKVLAKRNNYKIDVACFNEGQDIKIKNVDINRIKGKIKNINPGFSLKKIYADIKLFFLCNKLVRNNRYDFIHAGEEAVFMAMLFKLIYGIPYAYDLDSSIAQQLVEKLRFLKIFSPLFNFFEGLAIKYADINFPVCNALKSICDENKSSKTVTLHDISQLELDKLVNKKLIREETNSDNMILLYVGNLEKYQGIDLLIDSFKYAYDKVEKLDLVIIGGNENDIRKYTNRVKELGISERVYFLGPKPFENLPHYLAEADILTAPRINGINTPMKIFPYLHSAKPVLLTKLYTHTQIVNNDIAYLAEPTPKGFGEAIIELYESRDLREKYSKAGQEFIEANHTFNAHQKRLNKAYDWIEDKILNKNIVNLTAINSEGQ